MAKALYEFPPDVLFTDAARSALSASFHKMMNNANGTRKGDDIEALHDMRVGSRRLRSALAIFAKAFDREEYRALDREIGDITDALGAVRDLDVQLDYLDKLRAELPANEAYGIGRLMERQTKKRAKERKALVRALDALEKSRFERRFSKALKRALPHGGSDTSDTEEKE